MKDRSLSAWFIIIASMAITTRIAFLGYSTLTDEEAQMSQLVTYVLPCLKNYSFLEAMWRQLHMFSLNINPFQTLYPINIPIVWFFGPSEFNFRLQAAVSGFISCILIYFLVLRHSDKKTALFAMALVAFNPFLITFNRYDFGDSLQSAIFLLGVLFIDKFRESRKVTLLLWCSFCFSISFLLKANAIVFIGLILLLYRLFLGLNWFNIGIVLASFVAFVLVLFVDQLDLFLPSIFEQLRYIPTFGAIHQVGIYNLFIERIAQSWWFFTRAHVFYFEHTVFPLLIGLIFFKQIKNNLFRVLLFFSILYFIVLYPQGRTFFRYMQIGVITSSAAFAFVLARSKVGRPISIGTAILGIYIIWGFISHGTYISSQYHHIPYKYLKQRINELNPSGRVLIYGNNDEASYYLSPTLNLRHDESVDPCRVPVTRFVTYAEVAHKKVTKIPNELTVLFDPSSVKSGDIVVVVGIQMSGGEPNPLSLGIKRWGIKLWGIREYGHGYLRDVKAFYEEYQDNKRLQDQYVLLEKVFLSNGSDELAALILKKI